MQSMISALTTIASPLPLPRRHPLRCGHPGQYQDGIDHLVRWLCHEQEDAYPRDGEGASAFLAMRPHDAQQCQSANPDAAASHMKHCRSLGAPRPDPLKYLRSDPGGRQACADEHAHRPHMEWARSKHAPSQDHKDAQEDADSRSATTPHTPGQ